jgi:hypothetical protein
MLRLLDVYLTIIPVFSSSPEWVFGLLEAREWKELILQ